MGSICGSARKIKEDIYLCTKYKTYCHFDEPDKERCNEMYGIDDEDLSILDDVETVEDNIE